MITELDTQFTLREKDKQLALKWSREKTIAEKERDSMQSLLSVIHERLLDVDPEYETSGFFPQIRVLVKADTKAGRYRALLGLDKKANLVR